MSKLTIHHLDDELLNLLRQQAAERGCSAEQAAEDILRRVLRAQAAALTFAQRLHQRFAGLDVHDLPVPKRRAARASAKFS